MVDEEVDLVAVLLFIAITSVPFVLYLATLHKALSRVREGRRAMRPGLVWLNLIPIFSLVWHAYTVIQVGNSLASEMDARRIHYSGKPGLAMGLVVTVLFYVSIVPYLGLLAFVAGLVCWVIYWMQIGGYSRKIAAI